MERFYSEETLEGQQHRLTFSNVSAASQRYAFFAEISHSKPKANAKVCVIQNHQLVSSKRLNNDNGRGLNIDIYRKRNSLS